MKIVKIKDEYINQLYKVFPHVMLNKNEGGKYGRKYLGVLFNINNFKYYAPLSSPKSSDFNKDGSIKKSDLFTLRIVSKSKSRKKLLGKILLNCMIPVLDCFLIDVKFEKIKDINYKELLKHEIKWITSNKKLIIVSAINVYKFKKNQILFKNNINYLRYKNCLPFIEIENYINNHYKKVFDK